jgi:hypothetical protein
VLTLVYIGSFLVGICVYIGLYWFVSSRYLCDLHNSKLISMGGKTIFLQIKQAGHKHIHPLNKMIVLFH